MCDCSLSVNFNFHNEYGTNSHSQIKHSNKKIGCTWTRTHNLLASYMYLVCVLFVVGGFQLIEQ